MPLRVADRLLEDTQDFEPGERADVAEGSFDPDAALELVRRDGQVTALIGRDERDLGAGPAIGERKIVHATRHVLDASRGVVTDEPTDDRRGRHESYRGRKERREGRRRC